MRIFRRKYLDDIGVDLRGQMPGYEYPLNERLKSFWRRWGWSRQFTEDRDHSLFEYLFGTPFWCIKDDIIDISNDSYNGNLYKAAYEYFKDKIEIFFEKLINKFKRLKEPFTYGFHIYETYNLDTESAIWLYERVRAYKEHCIVNLNYHTFDIPVLYKKSDEELKNYDPVNSCVHNVVIETHTQGECIDYILEYLEFFLKDDLGFGIHDNTYDRYASSEKLKGAFQIYSIIILSMWW